MPCARNAGRPRSLAGRTGRGWRSPDWAPGVVALAVLAALALGRRLSKPLDTLAAAARRVGEGDFAARAAPTGITEIDDVGAALNGSSQRVRELIGRERTFSADASHQLRTPLAALRLELESAGLESPEREPGLTAAMTQVDRLQGTIETLLSVARGAPPGERSTDLKAAVTRARDRLARPPGRRRASASRRHRPRAGRRRDLCRRARRDPRRF